MIVSTTVGQISATVRVALSLSAAYPLMSCRLGYELVQLEQDGATASGTTSGDGGITSGSSDSGSGGAPGAATSTNAQTAQSVDGGQGGSITPFEATTDQSTSGQAGVPSNAGAAGEAPISSTSTASSTSGTSGTSSTGGTGPAEPIVHCNELRKLEGPPVLDGELEAGMYLEAVSLVGWIGDIDAAPAGNSLRYSAGWYDTGLYFYIDVTDPERNPADPSDHVWRGDSVEVYVDHDAAFAEPSTYDNPGTFQFIAGAPPSDSDPSTHGGIYAIFELQGPWSPTSWVSLPTEAGYRIEAFVSAADLGLPSWSLTPGTSIGFDIGQNVSYPIGETGDQANRAGQWFLNVADPLTGDVADYPFANSGVFCSAELRAP